MPGDTFPSAPKIKFDVSLGQSPRTQPQPRIRDASSPLGIMLLGNFTGNTNRSKQLPIAQRRALAVDSDNFETVLARMTPEVCLQTSSGSASQPSDEVNLQFGNLQDFHPDSLLVRLPRLQLLAEQRRRLLDPKTATAAVEEFADLLAAASPGAHSPTPESPVAPAPRAESADETLARLMGGAPRQSPAPTPAKGHGLDEFIKRLTASSTVPSTTPQQAGLLSVVHLELANGLRAVLHHSEFQALEAAWRGLDRLVRLFGGEENVKLYIADLAQEELTTAAEDPAQTDRLAEFFRRQTDEHELAICLGLYSFGPDIGQIDTLESLLTSTAASGLLLLAGASTALFGCDAIESQTAPEDWRTKLPADVAKAWQTLRERAEAGSLGLAVPRFLLRQPYGRQGEPLESFPFEELPASGTHPAYLWGNPALVCGQLLAEAFQADGWEMQLSGYGEVGDLPVHRFASDGGTQVKPCAEAWLSERAGEAILERGLIPLLSVKGRDAVLVPRLQSVTGEDLAIRMG